MSTATIAPPSLASVSTADTLLVPPPLPTFEEFLAWAVMADVRAEWVAGEVVPMSPANTEHQDLLAFLYRLCIQAAEEGSHGRVFFAPVALKLASRPSGREPDLIFVKAAHADRIKGTYIEGPADLVVEIVSPESDARDRGDKFVEYEAAAIPEYWLIDPLRCAVTVWRLGAERRYQAADLTADGIYESDALPGLRLRPEWLWQRPLPTPMAALARLARG
jgi:Uma2 family endonuclease